ncbi:MAG: hypothetical protein ACTSYC_09670 [Promethearchaeota archaeon]
MTRDVLVFFQAYINEMLDIGGENLPKTISSRLGAKLARSYKKKGINNIPLGLKILFKGMKAKIKINEVPNNKMEVINKYKWKFCPIGGKFNPAQAKITQEAICRPYMLGFLNEMDPEYLYSLESMECMLESNKKTCAFSITFEEKRKENKKNSNSL